MISLVMLVMLLLIPFVAGLTLYRRQDEWRLLGKTLMGVPMAIVVLLALFLLIAV